MYTLGICAPYRRSEITLAAIRLADLGRELAMDVRFLSVGPSQKNVDYVWDQRFRKVETDDAYRLLHGCTHLVWFIHDEDLHKKSQLVSPKARHWFIPSWHQIDTHVLRGLDGYSVVCPSRVIKSEIAERLQDDTKLSATWCLWDSGLDAVSREGLCRNDEVAIYVPMSSRVIDECGYFVLAAVRDVLELFPEAKFTLDFGKSWPRRARKYIKTLLKIYIDRLICHHSPSLLSQCFRMHAHDWTWLPDTRADIGIMAQRSLACGTPVITYDVSPYQEFVSDEVTGLVIQCEAFSNRVGAPIAGPNLVSIVRTMTKAITGQSELVSQCQKKIWKRESQHMKAFRLFWGKEWGVLSAK
jgi:glycosyltransferase involved in cell wall biosynthesis